MGILLLILNTYVKVMIVSITITFLRLLKTIPYIHYMSNLFFRRHSSSRPAMVTLCWLRTSYSMGLMYMLKIWNPRSGNIEKKHHTHKYVGNLSYILNMRHLPLQAPSSQFERRWKLNAIVRVDICISPPPPPLIIICHYYFVASLLILFTLHYDFEGTA